jgi:hypothetical protein
MPAQIPSTEFQRQLGELGPAGWLLMLGKLQAVHPLVPQGPLAAGNGAGKDAADRSLILQILAQSGQGHVIILPGVRDLSQAFPQAAPQCEYLRVASNGYLRFAKAGSP